MIIKPNLIQRLLVVFMMLALASMACIVGPATEKVVTPTEEPTQTEPIVQDTPVTNSTNITQPTQAPPTTGKVDIPQLESATVQILMVANKNGQLQVVASGSGTIISPDGLILTNSHVADPSAPGLAAFYQSTDLLFFPKIEQLIISMVESEDKPPVEKYVAKVAAVDGTIDLAVIRIYETVDGSPVDAGSLNLPFVSLGDSDTVRIGDTIHVFGFPGIGGDTITYTKGSISGFEGQSRVGNRTWIKTDTTIAHGNSGGLAANENNQIIGVPSRGDSEQGESINRLMTINLAKPLIDAAKKNQTYVSPHLVKGSGQEEFSLVSWADDFNQSDGCPVNQVQSYPEGTTSIVSVFQYQNMTDGEDFAFIFSRDGKMVGSNVYAWDSGAQGACIPYYYYVNNGQTLKNGTYTVEAYAGADMNKIGEAQTIVGATAKPPQGSGDTISVSGQVIDADTGKGISGAAVVVLLPGTDIDDFVNNPLESDIFTSAMTDSKGNFQLPTSLLKGVEYPVIAGAANAGYQNASGMLKYSITAPNKATLTVKLSR